jgi:hypothetical protein
MEENLNLTLISVAWIGGRCGRDFCRLRLMGFGALRGYFFGFDAKARALTLSSFRMSRHKNKGVA